MSDNITLAKSKLQAALDDLNTVVPVPIPDPVPPPGPTIKSFAVTPKQINAGDPATLSWVAFGVAVSRINGKPVFRPIDVLGTPGAMASMTVAPSKDASYTLEVEDANGVKVSQTVSLSVIAQPVPARPTIVQQKLNLGAVVGLQFFVPRDRYQRFAVDLVLKRTQLGYMHDDGVTWLVGLPFNKVDYLAGGALKACAYPKYGLLINGNERAVVDFGAHTYTLIAVAVSSTAYGTATFTKNQINYTPKVAGAPQISYTLEDDVTKVRTTGVELVVGTLAVQTFAIKYPAFGTFAGALVDEADGNARFDVVAYDASGNRVAAPVESFPTSFGHIDRNGGAKDAPDAVAQLNSFEWEKDAQSTHAFAIIPKANLKPIARPLFPGALEHFDTALPAAQIERSNLVPCNDENTNQLHYPCLLESGAMTMQTCQGYEPTIMYAQQAALPHLDGPRGAAMVHYALATWIGLNGKIYFTEPGAFSVIDLSGTKRTLAGIQHTTAPYYKEISRTHPGPYSVIKGLWDASIPPSEQFVQESWGIAPDRDSFALDASAPINGVPSHVLPGPRFGLTDVHGWILIAQANGRDHAAPYVMSRLCAVSYPWSIAWSKEGDTPVWTVTERNAFRISKWHALTGAPLGNLLANPNGAAFVWFDSLDQTKATRHDFHYQAGVTLEQCRAQPFLYGEGYVEQDGFGYWGCAAQQEIRRVNKATGAIEVCCRVPWGWLSSYIQIAISDGTFGPRGTLFCTTFSNNGYGRAFARLPTPGVAADGVALTHSAGWAYHNYQPGVVAGPGATDSAAYATTVGVGNGLLVSATCQRGFDVFRKSSAAPIDYAKATRGRAYWYSKSYQVVFGPTAYGPTNYPLPWGENADLDYWLTVHGHANQ